jgi:predicted MPP superfamily phosphohydrolase
MYGVPGNHDYWGKPPFNATARCFEATSGAWLLDQQRVTPDGKFCISGATHLSGKHVPLQPEPKVTNILLIHYPAWVKKPGNKKFDLILAGHSHGGQVRLPLYGPVYGKLEHLCPWVKSR